MMRHWCLPFLSKLVVINKTRHLSTMAISKRVAICQMTSVADKQKNLEVVTELIRDACNENVQMIFFPEACDFICDNKKDTLNSSEPLLTGETVCKYRALAAANNVWLSMGGVHEKDENNPTKLFNTHIIIDNKGNVVQTYRKLHLFDVEIPEKNVRLKESEFISKGEHIVTPVDTPVGSVGLAICYDMRFPELSTILSMLNANILTFPSAFTQPTGKAHWHTLLRARAIENQCYVIAAAQQGDHNAKRRSYGYALCVDPWGTVLADCEQDSPGFRIAEIDSDRLDEVRQNMPVFHHRRRDVYSLSPLKLRKALPSVHCSDSKMVKSESDTTEAQYSGPTHVFGHVRIPETCVFYKSELTYAFVNLRCVTPGHVLVAPLRPAERNNDLTETEAADFYKTVRTVQALMERVHNTDSCTVTIQDGPEAGQTVKHLHCHIMPRKKGDFISKGLFYLALAQHDGKLTESTPSPPRPLQEREYEAAMLRREITILLKHLHCHIMPRKRGDFKENDLIYLELAKHDKLEHGQPTKPARSLEEMENEATLLRQELTSYQEK